MVTKEWAAIHRKHHAFSDKPGDPHSPKVYGIKKVFWEGVELYQQESVNLETLEKYGSGTPNDWLEKNIYSNLTKSGIMLMLGINILLFGVSGIVIWAIQMLWIPIFAAGVINGLGHFIGYRNFQCPDASRNLFPIGFLIGGEELHNNHHTFGTSAKLSSKWYEFDIGWTWIKLLSYVKLAKIKKTCPVLQQQKIPKLIPDFQTLDAVITNRYRLMMHFAKSLKRECRNELLKIQSNFQEKINWHTIKTLLAKDEDLLTPLEKNLIQKFLIKVSF
jgi:stearoyl-CoA desaturase (delta-9 desaturase)